MEKAINYNKAIQIYLIVKLVIAGLFFIAACGFMALGFLVYTLDGDLSQDINSLTYGVNIFIGVVAFALVIIVIAYIASFVWDNKFLDYVCITFKSECSDIVEALVLVEKKEDALAIISEMFDTGSYDATDNNTVVLTEEVWKKYLNM